MAPSATRRRRSCCRRQQDEGERDSFANNNMNVNSFGAESDHHNKEKEKESGFSTPKGKRFRIPEMLTCPAAPMKPKLISTRSSNSAINFFTPPDIDLFFFLAFHNLST